MKIAALAAALAIGVSGCGASRVVEDSRATEDLSPSVRVFAFNQPEGSHGSGVHIGNGYILTAAHVTSKIGGVVGVKTKNGSTIKAVKLWSNADYDVALLRTNSDRSAGLGSAYLDCSGAQVGDHIYAIGSPGILEFVTTYGRVAGEAKNFNPFEVLVPMDITVSGGSSGGGVFNTDGYVVGIAVGGMLDSYQGNSYGSGYTFMVPSEAICMLMGWG